MPLDRIPGPENLYIGSVMMAASQKLLDAHHITHIVSVLQYTAAERAAIAAADAQRIAAAPEEQDPKPTPRQRLFVDVDDVEDEDLLVHFPRIVRFIDSAFAAGADSNNGVLVHCAMGKSRSATAVIAYLLWKHGDDFAGDNDAGGDGDKDAAAAAAVDRALARVRMARPIAEPNPGFMQQLALWRRMGCPAGSDDAVETNPAYQHWLYRRDVEESARIGRAPERLWFGDEAGVQHAAVEGQEPAKPAKESVLVKCKKCRRKLVDSAFIVPHAADGEDGGKNTCQHVFVEPLSWMRPVLEQGALEGRLVCPNSRCGALVGRYSWQGFKCTCRAWVCPAFSLQASRVDQAVVAAGVAGGNGAGASNTNPHNIRMPPGMSKV